MSPKPSHNTNPNDSRLDLRQTSSPPTHPILSHPPVPRKEREQDQAQRLATLHTILADVATTMAIREELITLARREPKFHPRSSANLAWRAQADAHARIYQTVKREMERAERDASVTGKRLARWEALVEPLRRWARNRSEVVDEEGRWESSRRRTVRGILEEGWRFEGACRDGGGKEEEEVVDPRDTGKMNPAEDPGNRYAEKYAGFADTSSRFG